MYSAFVTFKDLTLISVGINSNDPKASNKRQLWCGWSRWWNYRSLTSNYVKNIGQKTNNRCSTWIFWVSFEKPQLPITTSSLKTKQITCFFPAQTYHLHGNLIFCEVFPLSTNCKKWLWTSWCSPDVLGLQVSQAMLC